MIANIIAFLAGPLGKIVGYVALGAVAIGGYIYWEHRTEERGREEFNKKQIEQALKDSQEYKRQLEELRGTIDRIQIEMNTKNAELDKSLEKVNEFLNSKEAIQQDKPASPLLKETIRQLSGGKK